MEGWLMSTYDSSCRKTIMWMNYKTVDYDKTTWINANEKSDEKVFIKKKSDYVFYLTSPVHPRGVTRTWNREINVWIIKERKKFPRMIITTSKFLQTGAQTGFVLCSWQELLTVPFDWWGFWGSLLLKCTRRVKTKKTAVNILTR